VRWRSLTYFLRFLTLGVFSVGQQSQLNQLTPVTAT
jgi:hypothetical protein